MMGTREPAEHGRARSPRSPKRVGAVEGTKAIRSSPDQCARRAVRARNPDPGKALTLLEKALEELRKTRSCGAGRRARTYCPAWSDYEETIRYTIGLRQQRRLPEEPALYVASCNSGHRDISLNF